MNMMFVGSNNEFLLQVLEKSQMSISHNEENIESWLEYTFWDGITGEIRFQIDNRNTQNEILFLGLMAFSSESNE